jgi:hypothetical protein
VAFAERITAHKTCSILRFEWGFSFLFELFGNSEGLGFMADKVQAKKDLEFCSAELSKYQNLSRSGLTLNEMRTIDGIMIKLKDRIKNLREALFV